MNTIDVTSSKCNSEHSINQNDSSSNVSNETLAIASNETLNRVHQLSTITVRPGSTVSANRDCDAGDPGSLAPTDATATTFTATALTSALANAPRNINTTDNNNATKDNNSDAARTNFRLVVLFLNEVVCERGESGRSIMTALAASSLLLESTLKDTLASTAEQPRDWWRAEFDDEEFYECDQTGDEEEEDNISDRSDDENKNNDDPGGCNGRPMKRENGNDTSTSESGNVDKKRSKYDGNCEVPEEIPDSAFFMASLVILLLFAAAQPLPLCVIASPHMTLNLKFEDYIMIVDGTKRIVYFDELSLRHSEETFDDFKRGLALKQIRPLANP